MKFFDNLLSKFGFASKKSFMDFQPFGFYDQNFLRQLNRDEYLVYYGSRVYIAVSTKANDIASLNYRFLNKKDGSIITNDLYDFIDYDLLEGISSYLDLAGTSYIMKIKNNSGNIIGLKLLESHNVQTEVNSLGMVDFYRYIYYGTQVVIQPEDMIVFKDFNPNGGPRGYGGVQAGSFAIQQNYESDNYNLSFYKNGANPGNIFETDQNINQDVYSRMETSINKKFRGSSRAHKLMILTNGLKLSKNMSQKDMDFVSSKRFTRDEILGIFKVSPQIIGISVEGSNANIGKKEAEKIYSKRTLLPRALNIQNTLNKHLFVGKGYFEFVNVVPADVEEKREDYKIGAITKNEYRKIIGYKEVDGGDQFIYQLDGSIQEGEDSEKSLSKTGQQIFKSFKKGVQEVKKQVKFSEEYMIEKHDQKISRNNKFEKTYATELRKIFKQQENEILNSIKIVKVGGLKKFKKTFLNITKWGSIFVQFMSGPQEDLVQREADLANKELGIPESFFITKEFRKVLSDNIFDYSKSINGTTNDKLKKVYDIAIEQDLGVEDTKKLIKGVFKDLSENRIESIVRTETIRAGNMATIRSWKSSGVVVGKQWWTALDERVCPFCGPKHGQIVQLNENFNEKGDVLNGVDESGKQVSLKLDYSVTPAGPLHPNCRCDLIPILA